MSLPSHDTLVSYPDGATVSTGTVLHVEPLDGGLSAVILDTTAFHPVDTAWPDQPSDRGVIRSAAGDVRIDRAVMGGVRDGELLLGTDLPVRTGTEGWTFVVAHLVDGDAPAEGESVEVVADAELRAALCAGHTACHLASLALDDALADSWTKETPLDALGHPAFDQLAIVTSRIHEHGSIDTYRIGKSLRRKGFALAGLDDLDAVAARANALLADWISRGGSVRIERDDAAITARRTWVCALPDGEARIPCGGTHVDDLSAFAGIEVELERTAIEGGLQLVMTTTARMA